MSVAKVITLGLGDFNDPERLELLGFGPQVAFDAASNSGYQTAQSTYSWSHTCTGNYRFLAVDIAVLSVPGTTVTGITYNGVPLVFIGARSTISGAGRIECWGLANPASGSHTIAVTLSASVASTGLAVSYVGVQQTTATEAFNSAQATNVGAADATVAVTSIADQDWVHGAVATDDTAITANQTSRNNVSGIGGSGADEDTGPKTPAGAVTVSYTNVGALATWAIGGYGIRPLSAPNDQGSGSVSFSFTAAAAGVADVIGSGAASVSFTASAVGKDDAIGSGASTVTFTAAGGGRADAVGSGASSVSFTATAVGAANAIGSGAATASFTASAIGKADSVGSGAVSFIISAGGSGISDEIGSGSASVSFAVSGAGVVDAVGSGASIVTFTASAVGAATAVGSGSSSFSFTADGAGISTGGDTTSGAAEFSFTAAAVGAADAIGSGLAPFSITAGGSGTISAIGSGAVNFSFSAQGAGASDIVVIAEPEGGSGRFSSYFLPAGRKASDYAIKPPVLVVEDKIDKKARELVKAALKKKRVSFLGLDDDFELLRKH